MLVLLQQFDYDGHFLNKELLNAGLAKLIIDIV